MSENILKKELELFDKKKDELVKENLGKYVLIKENRIIGLYDTEKDAIKVGIDKFGNVPFLVKKVEKIEQSHNFTSNLIKVGTTCPQ